MGILESIELYIKFPIKITIEVDSCLPREAFKVT